MASEPVSLGLPDCVEVVFLVTLGDAEDGGFEGTFANLDPTFGETVSEKRERFVCLQPCNTIF